MTKLRPPHPHPLGSSHGEKCGVNQHFQCVMGATKAARHSRERKEQFAASNKLGRGAGVTSQLVKHLLCKHGDRG